MPELSLYTYRSESEVIHPNTIVFEGEFIGAMTLSILDSRDLLPYLLMNFKEIRRKGSFKPIKLL